MSLLDLIRIATPCSVAWSSMTGSDRARHCGQCDKTVFDLSQLTRAEAEALLAEKGDNLCGRYFQRTDGTIVLADCLIRRRNKRIATVGVIAAAALVGGAAIAMHEPATEVAPLEVDLPDVEQVTMPEKDTELGPDMTEEQQELDELRRKLADPQFKHHGEMMGGAISFDYTDDNVLVGPANADSQ